MTEKSDLITDWKAVYGELHGNLRDPDVMRIDDPVLAGLLLLRREVSLLREELDLVRKTRVIEPAYAEGYTPDNRVKTKGGRGAGAE